MYGLVRIGALARVAPRMNVCVLRYRKQTKRGAEEEDDDDGRSGSDYDPDLQGIDQEVAVKMFSKYWTMPEKPEKVKRSPELQKKDAEYIKRYNKLAWEQHKKEVKMYQDRIMHMWEAIFELPPHLMTEALKIDDSVPPTYPPLTDTPPNPSITEYIKKQPAGI
eukprot:TRINITY_DN6490_c0_g1_i1.p1 TRINITY_DN6490_c0_g1~~TRINITY_DN6490_c0_g1_i1.p1  ORF type:complete len:164 (+),score=47.58 TRINITY_DN6490_c0_g1_i1:630-1121(+)